MGMFYKYRGLLSAQTKGKFKKVIKTRTKAPRHFLLCHCSYFRFEFTTTTPYSSKPNQPIRSLKFHPPADVSTPHSLFPRTNLNPAATDRKPLVTAAPALSLLSVSRTYFEIW